MTFKERINTTTLSNNFSTYCYVGIELLNLGIIKCDEYWIDMHPREDQLMLNELWLTFRDD